MNLAKDILDLQEDPIFLIDKKNTIVFANNPAIEKGFVRKDYQDKPYYDVLRPFELISNVETLKKENRPLKIAYKEKYYSVYKKNLQEYFVFFMKDITKFEQYQKAKRDFIANASHELKTPLSIIKSVLDLIQDQNTEESLNRFIKKAKNACESMEELISDMLTLSFVESMEDNVKLENIVDIKSLIQETIELFQTQIKNKNLSLKFNVESHTLKTNKKLLEIIIKNLIDNAIKYNKENGSLEIYSKRVDDVFELFIKDSGIGIAKEHIPFIFERFYSISKDRSYKSTGLGLAIVKHASRLLKINIDLESEIDVGTTFKLSFSKTQGLF